MKEAPYTIALNRTHVNGCGNNVFGEARKREIDEGGFAYSTNSVDEYSTLPTFGVQPDPVA
jgi:hypothetical protein